MPGFTTHYLFGLNSFRELEEPDLVSCIRKFPHAFCMGLQGPDIFFYYLPSYLRSSGNIGQLAHHKNTGVFLTQLLKSKDMFLEETEQQIAISYICGFLGHYVLDTTCHPYIFAKSHYGTYDKGYFGHHVYLETDIDAELLTYYKNCAPSEFNQSATLHISRKERHIIASLLLKTYSSTYKEYRFTYRSMQAALEAVQLNTAWIRDPQGKKKVLARKIEAKTLGYACISPLIPSDYFTFTVDPLNLRHFRWRNPWNKEDVSHESFFDLLDTAGTQYQSVLNKTARLFTLPIGTPVYREQLDALSLELGNNSYDSGLPLKKNS